MNNYIACRAFYYYFITAEVWSNMKFNIAEEKLDYL